MTGWRDWVTSEAKSDGRGAVLPLIRSTSGGYAGQLALATMAGYEQIHSSLCLLLIAFADGVRRWWFQHYESAATSTSCDGQRKCCHEWHD